MRVAIVLLLAAVAIAAPVPKGMKKAKRPDAELFVGAWEMVEGPGGAQLYVWTFDEGLTMWSKAVGSEGPGSRWVVTITPDTSPKEMELTSDRTRYEGIYEIDGDEIRIVYGGNRPTAFEGKGKLNYTVLRRVPEKK